jgi:hypothetical protein
MRESKMPDFWRQTPRRVSQNSEVAIAHRNARAKSLETALSPPVIYGVEVQHKDEESRRNERSRSDALALRTALLGVGSAGVMLSLAAVASCPAVNPRLRRQPWAVVLGLLILLCIRFGRASAHPLLQAEGDRTLFVKLCGCVTGIVCSLIIIKEGKGCCAKVDRHPEEEMAKLKKALNKLEEQYAAEGHKLSSELARVSRARAQSASSAAAGAPGVKLRHMSSLHPEFATQHKDYRKVYEKYTNMRSKLQLYKMTARDNDYGRETKSWLWLLVGPPLASAFPPDVGQENKTATALICAQQEKSGFLEPLDWHSGPTGL